MDIKFISDRAAAVKVFVSVMLAGGTYFSENIKRIQDLAKLLKESGLPTELVWWLFIVVFGAAAAYYLLQSLAQRSRLLQPERFRLNPADPVHLKGREQDIERLAKLCDKHALVFLDGESGSGKSALLVAGLIPYSKADRTRPLVLHCDLSGASWDAGLSKLVAQAFHRSLTEQQMQDLGWQDAPSADTVFTELTRVARVLGRKPLLAFDQFDDYQDDHRQFFYREGSGELLSASDFLANNQFWRTISQGVHDDSWHVLFMTRSDQYTGLELVRFIEPGIYSLMRVDSNLIGPVLDNITAEKDGRSVIDDPNKGWSQLREKLLDDLKDRNSNDVLPIQLAISLQGLQKLSFLTLREYAKVGGVAGLGRLQIKSEIAQTAKACRLNPQHVLHALDALTDAERGKTRRLSQDILTAHLLGVENAVSRPDAERKRAHEALEQLKTNHILRSGVDIQTNDEYAGDWLLYHDHLVPSIVAAVREYDRWHLELLDHAKRSRQAGNWYRWWQTLLPVSLQARLAWERWHPKFNSGGKKTSFFYGEQRHYAAWSLLKPLCATLVVVVILTTGIRWQRNQQDEAVATALLNTLSGTNKIPSEKEFGALSAVEERGSAAASLALARLFRKVTPTSRGSVDHTAKEVEKVFARLVHIALGVDGSSKSMSLLLQHFEVASAPATATDQQLVLLMTLLSMAPPTVDVNTEVTKEVLVRIADKGTDKALVEILASSIAKVKLNNDELIHKAVQALVDRMRDKVIGEGELPFFEELSLGYGLANLVDKVNDDMLARKWAQAIVEQMTKTTNSLMAATLGRSLAKFDAKVKDGKLTHQWAQAIVERMTDKTTNTATVGELGRSLVSLAAKVNDDALLHRAEQALVDRMMDGGGRMHFRLLSSLSETLSDLTDKANDSDLVRKAAQVLVDRMTDKATTGEMIPALGGGLVKLSAKASDDVLVHNWAQTIFERITGKAADIGVAYALGDVLAGLTTKMNDDVLVRIWEQALVERMADKATDNQVVVNLGKSLASLTIKVNDDVLARKAAQALVDRMTDKAATNEMVSALGESLVGLSAKASDDALMHKGAQALVERMMNKTTDTMTVMTLSQKLAPLTLTTKLNSNEWARKGLQAIFERIVTKKAPDSMLRSLFSSTFRDDSDTFRIDENLAILVARMNDDVLVDKWVSALIDRMSDKTTNSKEVSECGAILVVLTERSPVNQREKILATVLRAEREHHNWMPKKSQYLSQALSNASLVELVSALRSHLGAPGQGRDVLIDALRIKLNLREETYWEVITAIQGRYPKVFVEIPV